MGDVTHIYDTNGALKAHYIYDAWGNHRIITNVDNIGTINPIRYRGYYEWNRIRALFATYS